LGWHRVDLDGGSIAVTPRVFASQMELLARRRDQLPVLSLDAASAELAGAQPLRHGVVLTFDDAWADNHENALGPVNSHQLPAIIYVPSQLLGTPGYMTHAQLDEMVHAGFDVGGHTRTHPDLRRKEGAELDNEIRGGRNELEDLVGRPVIHFAYPYGHYDDRVLEAARRAGYQTAVTTHLGSWRPSTPLHEIPRAFVENVTDATFVATARGGMNGLAPIEAVHRALSSVGIRRRAPVQ
jgi:peptidoglycan/xylan/chitin deacetylase (PgdA/CDA1 family)